MLTTSLIAVLSSLLLVNAQDPQIEVESIEQQFQNAYIVPDLIASFDPLAFLTVDFNGNPVSPGTLLAVAGQSPSLTPKPPFSKRAWHCLLSALRPHTENKSIIQLNCLNRRANPAHCDGYCRKLFRLSRKSLHSGYGRPRSDWKALHSRTHSSLARQWCDYRRQRSIVYPPEQRSDHRVRRYELQLPVAVHGHLMNIVICSSLA
jgi:hypothetical protein